MKRTALENLSMIDIRPKKENAQSPKYRSKLLLLISIFILSISALSYLTQIRKVSIFPISGETYLPLENWKGKNLIFFDLKKAKNNLENSNFPLKVSYIKKKYPGTVEVYTHSEQVKFIVIEPNKFLSIGQDNKITGIYRSALEENLQNIPKVKSDLVTGYAFYQVGQILKNKSYLNAFEIIEYLYSKGFAVDRIQINTKQELNLVFDQKELFMSLDSSGFVEKKQQLELILLPNFRSEFAKIQEIDLRFDKLITR